jgi:phenylacetate-CoA ligase
MLLALQHQLEHSQWWPAAVLERHQRRQLGHLLDHAAATVPFYGRRLTAAGYRSGRPLTPELWRSLPVLRRREVQDAAESLLSTAVPAGHGATRRVATSGTTGTPVTVVKTQLEQLIWQAVTLREELWHARQWQGTVAVIRGFPEGRYAYPEGGQIEDWGSPLADVYPTGAGVALDMTASVTQQAEWLIRRNPDYLLTDAANLRRLAEHFRAQGLALPRLRDARAVGDVVDETLRRTCRDAWGIAVIDIYSCTEAGYLAIQCPEHEQPHVQMESVVLEIVDEAGRPCAPGAVGEVVVTPLHNFATPFIRYAIGDRAEMGEPCACGRGLTTIKRVLGRTQQRPGAAP